MIEISIPVWLLLVVGLPTYLLAGVGTVVTFDKTIRFDPDAPVCIAGMFWPAFAVFLLLFGIGYGLYRLLHQGVEK